LPEFKIFNFKYKFEHTFLDEDEDEFGNLAYTNLWIYYKNTLLAEFLVEIAHDFRGSDGEMNSYSVESSEFIFIHYSMLLREAITNLIDELEDDSYKDLDEIGFPVYAITELENSPEFWHLNEDSPEQFQTINFRLLPIEIGDGL